jgi:suppressor of ftsI
MRKAVLLLACVLVIACTQQVSNVQQTQDVLVASGELFSLTAAPATGSFSDKQLDLYAYNGQMPGPRIRVKQGSTITVNFTNNLPEPTTVHWHGLRLQNKFDGVPGITQQAVQPGESFVYELAFPDAGVFWYHPHVREDRQQDMGLYGNIVVEPVVTDGLQEEFLFIDDVKLTEDGVLAVYGVAEANHVLMGRFGNTLLINGKTNYSFSTVQGNSVRFTITSAAAARPFNLSFGVPVILEGSDAGSYEQEQWVDSLVIGPAERYRVRIPFNDAGVFSIRNTNLWQTYELGTIIVRPSSTRADEELKDHPEVTADIEEYRRYFSAAPDAELNLDIHLDHAEQAMHSITNIEWEDVMEEENAHTTPEDVTWLITDAHTNRSNMNFSLSTPVNSVRKVRINNLNSSAHPMHHLMHLHGQRFLVIATDGVENNNLVWKDTVLVPSGTTVDLLIAVTNPGEWVFHCHIPEHMEAGMMTLFTVGTPANTLGGHE